MTTDSSPEVSGTEIQERFFAINPNAIEAAGRSVNALLSSRLCEASRAKLKSSDAWKTMKFRELRRLIKQNCVTDPEFFNPQFSVMEMSFRILLTHPKDPLSLTQLHYEIMHVWMESSWPRHIDIASLGRVLTHDTYYGVVEVTPQ
jgi:hypothetical protein